MRFTPRKAEVDTIVAKLESGEHEDAQALAKAVLLTAYDLILERDWYVTVLGGYDERACWGYGLSASPAEAQKLALWKPARVIPITSASKKLKEMEA